MGGLGRRTLFKHQGQEGHEGIAKLPAPLRDLRVLGGLRGKLGTTAWSRLGWQG